MKIDVKSIAKNKKISKQDLSALAQISLRALANLYDGKTERIYFDTLEKLCFALDCTPNDLLIQNMDEFKAKKLEYQKEIKEQIDQEYLERLEEQKRLICAIQEEYQHLSYGEEKSSPSLSINSLKKTNEYLSQMNKKRGLDILAYTIKNNPKIKFKNNEDIITYTIKNKPKINNNNNEIINTNNIKFET